MATFGNERDSAISKVIMQVQSKLNALHIPSPPLLVDGIAGPKTRAAIFNYQQSKNLTETGTIDNILLISLGLLQSPSFGAEDQYGWRSSVLNYFPTFTVQFEGRENNMYLDDSDAPGGPFVTTGIGNLIDPLSVALGLPWIHKSDGSPASVDEITSEWELVKSRTDLAPQGGGVFKSITQLMLSDQAVDDLVRAKMKENEPTLLAHYPNLGDWPADAQVALMSMSWAMGPAFNFPQFKAATDRLDFATANAQSEYHGVGAAPRIAADHILLNNADIVQRNGMNKDTIWYPNTAVPGGGSGVSLGSVAKVGLALGAGYLAFRHQKEIASFVNKKFGKKVFST